MLSQINKITLNLNLFTQKSTSLFHPNELTNNQISNIPLLKHENETQLRLGELFPSERQPRVFLSVIRKILTFVERTLPQRVFRGILTTRPRIIFIGIAAVINGMIYDTCLYLLRMCETMPEHLFVAADEFNFGSCIKIVAVMLRPLFSDDC